MNAPVLVMEGWLHPPAVSVAAEKFLAGHYEYIVTTGGPVPSGRISVETWADAGAYWLRQTGLPDQNIRRAPAAATDRDRTYQSALGLKRWLRANAPAVRAFNIVTEGAHARRTRLLFQKAFGSEFNVGIIATQNPEYNSRVWWQSSEGVRETLGENYRLHLCAVFLLSVSFT